MLDDMNEFGFRVEEEEEGNADGNFSFLACGMWMWHYALRIVLCELHGVHVHGRSDSWQLALAFSFRF